MLISRLIRNIARGRKADDALGDVVQGPTVLNVGGASKSIAIPAHYAGHEHLLLDIAPGPDVDVVCDARDLVRLEPQQFDAIYCSHNLEHYYAHDCRKVLAGFRHVLKAGGIVEIRVPDMAAVLRTMVTQNMEIDDVLYQSGAGPITVHDVIYGWGAEIERSGVDFYAHKRGFTQRSLVQALTSAGFDPVTVAPPLASYELRVFAFCAPPSAEQLRALNLPT